VANNRIVIDASTQTVFRTLVEPANYAYWVVGSKTVRAVDENWPEPGSSFHHRVGIGPLSVEDSSTVLAIERPTSLDLEVRFRPVGVATVQLRLEPIGDDRATLVTIAEAWSGGWALRLGNLLVDEVVGVRNAWSLRRLRRLANQRLDDLGADPTPIAAGVPRTRASSEETEP
jgi:uncharacterized protein YndB with AHSA1/START domain